MFFFGDSRRRRLSLFFLFFFPPPHQFHKLFFEGFIVAVAFFVVAAAAERICYRKRLRAFFRALCHLIMAVAFSIGQAVKKLRVNSFVTWLKFSFLLFCFRSLFSRIRLLSDAAKRTGMPAEHSSGARGRGGLSACEAPRFDETKLRAVVVGGAVILVAAHQRRRAKQPTAAPATCSLACSHAATPPPL